MTFLAYINPTQSLHVAYINLAKNSSKRALLNVCIGADTTKGTTSQVLRLIVVAKFSREFATKIRASNCQIGRLALNSLENFVATLMVEYAERVS